MNNNTPYQPIQLGAPGRPYPTMGNSRVVETAAGDKILIPPQLEVLEAPIQFYSQRSYAEVMGLAYREMPVFEMLPLFFRALLNNRPGSPTAITMFLGPPGPGKSHDANLIARMASPEGAVVVDCANKNLEELLFETVLDMDAGRSIYSKIEEKLAEGTLNPMSLQLLRENLGKGYSEQGGVGRIDWEAVGTPMGETDKEGTDDKLKRAINAIEEVKVFEALNGASGSLRIKSRYGPLIRAWTEDRKIICDEYTKSREGTDGKLQVVWQVFNDPKVTEHTVTGGGGLQFIFRRSERKPNFHCFITGNTAEDGSMTRDLDRSAYDRLGALYVEEATTAGLQHRATQLLTGLPVSTMQKIEESRGPVDDEKFLPFLKTMLELGLTAEERKNIPDWQRRVLECKAEVLQATEQLAGFYQKWKGYYQADSPNRPAEILMEVDEMEAQRVNPGYRMMMKHFNQAIQPEPDSVPLAQSQGFGFDQDWSQPPALGSTSVPTPERYLGTRICRAILEEIENTTLRRNKPNLYRLLLKDAADFGIGDPELLEAMANTAFKTIPGLLNIDPYKGIKLTKEAEQLQTIFCALLRERHPDLSRNDDDIIKPIEIQVCLNRIAEERREKETPTAKFLCVANPHFLDGSLDKTLPFVLLPVMDGFPQSQEVTTGTQTWQPPAPGDVMTLEECLGALTYPSAGERNLNALWNYNISEAHGISPDMAKGMESVAMAQNQSSSGLSITSVYCRKTTGGVSEFQELVIVRDAVKNKTLVVGESKLSSAMLQALAQSSLVYINGTDSRAERDIDLQISSLLAGKPKTDELSANLLNAFYLRHRREDESKPGDKLSRTIASKRPALIAPQYLFAPPASSESAKTAQPRRSR